MTDAGSDHGRPTARTLFRYRFGNVEFDEASHELRVAGLDVPMEQRPAQVLACLLQHSGEVVPRETLFHAVWADRPTVDNVLANAVAKLRKALGTADAEHIVTLPRIGYRFAGKMERIAIGQASTSQLEAGMAVPGREHFRLRQRLGPSPASEVWLARHEKTGEQRVFKFSVHGRRLPSLKREATIYRVLLDSLGQRNDFARVLDWNFERAPYYLECEYVGPDLADWGSKENALAGMAKEARITLFLGIADGIAAAHQVGVLHKDIKPANVLIEEDGENWRPRIADFGSSRLLEPGRLEELGITGLGFTVTQALLDDYSGTPLYLAPELIAGQPPTVQSDVYALGLLLYQLMIGDFHRPMATGWEQEIEDELLREDIAAATNGSPERRLASVVVLCRRLRQREARGAARARQRLADTEAQATRRKLQQMQARRPWVFALVLVLLTALIASLWQFQRTRRARDDAERQAHIAAATNQFLNDDVLGGGVGGHSPVWYESDPTLRDVLDLAASRVNERFPNEPMVAADIHLTLAGAYRSTGAYKIAAEQLSVAIQLMQSMPETDIPRRIRAQYELTIMLGHLSQFEEAETLLASADQEAALHSGASKELGLRSHLAHGGLAYQRMQFADALKHYRAARGLQKTLHPDNVTLAARLLNYIAGCELRLGNHQAAEATARQLLAGAPYTEASVGLGNLASARVRLGNALRHQGRFHEAIPIFRQALADFTQVQGKSGQNTISTLSLLGYLVSLDGEEQQALEIQRDVYQRSLTRWGAENQYTLVELLNLGMAEQALGKNENALQHIRAAIDGLGKLGNPNSPAINAGRVSLADLLSDMGRHREALTMIRSIDPAAYQAASSAPGKIATLQAVEARIMLRMGKRTEALPMLRTAIAAMEAASVPEDQIKPFRELLVTPADAADDPQQP